MYDKVYGVDNDTLEDLATVNIHQDFMRAHERLAEKAEIEILEAAEEEEEYREPWYWLIIEDVSMALMAAGFTVALIWLLFLAPGS